MEQSKETYSKSLHQFPSHFSILKTPARLRQKFEPLNSTKSVLNATTSLAKFQNFTPKDSLFTISKTSKSEKSDKSLFVQAAKKNQSKNAYEAAVKELQFPISPGIIINAVPGLPEWVKTELIKYPQVYFFSKIQKTADPTLNENDGDYKVTIGEDIDYRYEIIDILGKGTFGQVVKVYDHQLKKFTAMKIIKSRQRYLDQAQIEISILKFLNSNKADSKANTVSFEGDFLFRNHMVNPI